MRETEKQETQRSERDRGVKEKEEQERQRSKRDIGGRATEIQIDRGARET